MLSQKVGMIRSNYIIYRLFLNLIGIGAASIFFKHIDVDSFLTLLISAVILTVLNIFLKPVLLLLTLPIQIFSLGLFYMVINAIILKLTASMVGGFYIDGFWSAVGGSLIIGLVNVVFDLFSTNSDLRNLNWKKMR